MVILKVARRRTGRDHAITRPLGEGRAGALESLAPLVYDQLRGMAESFLRGERPEHTLQPTAVVNEVFLDLLRVRRLAVNDRAHFFAFAAQLTRRVLIDSARKAKAEKRGRGWTRIPLDAELAWLSNESAESLDLSEALNELKSLDLLKPARSSYTISSVALSKRPPTFCRFRKAPWNAVCAFRSPGCTGVCTGAEPPPLSTKKSLRDSRKSRPSSMARSNIRRVRSGMLSCGSTMPAIRVYLKKFINCWRITIASARPSPSPPKCCLNSDPGRRPGFMGRGAPCGLGLPCGTRRWGIPDVGRGKSGPAGACVRGNRRTFPAGAAIFSEPRPSENRPPDRRRRHRRRPSLFGNGVRRRPCA